MENFVKITFHSGVYEKESADPALLEYIKRAQLEGSATWDGNSVFVLDGFQDSRWSVIRILERGQDPHIKSYELVSGIPA
jgi:hypothetical protein